MGKDYAAHGAEEEATVASRNCATEHFPINWHCFPHHL
jgi:hypothetical protein